MTVAAPAARGAAAAHDPGPSARGASPRSTARVSQASERLVLSYPRADARTGRERLPSLFFAAAAAALAGRPLAGAGPRPLDQRGRDRPPARSRTRSTRASATASACCARPDAAARARGGLGLLPRSRASPRRARWSSRLTRVRRLRSARWTRRCARRLDPLRSRAAMSASRLATFARCGFQYLLQHVLQLEPAPEPEERRRLDPLERGDLFHRVAERFLRERRERGELPLRDTPALRARLRRAERTRRSTDWCAAPRRASRLLWEREKRRFHETAQRLVHARGRQAGARGPRTSS